MFFNFRFATVFADGDATVKRKSFLITCDFLLLFSPNLQRTPFKKLSYDVSDTLVDDLVEYMENYMSAGNFITNNYKQKRTTPINNNNNTSTKSLIIIIK